MSPWTEFELISLVVISTNCTGSCKFNCHTITTTTAPPQRRGCFWSLSSDDVVIVYMFVKGPPWSYGSRIYNYLCNQCLSPLMLWVRISIRARYTTLCDTFCQWLATGRWFSPGPPVSSTNKTDLREITEILLKVALNTIKQTNKHISHGLLTELV